LKFVIKKSKKYGIKKKFAEKLRFLMHFEDFRQEKEKNMGEFS
jgi:hypothetical protein